MKLHEMTGEQLLTAMANGDLPPPSITNTMPMRLVEVRHGYVKFIATADDRHLNPLGGVHGGFAATVLDSATACAVHAALDAGVGYGTVDLNVKMVRPVPRNQELIAEGRLLNLSRTIAIAEAILTDAQGKLYAHATCTCSINRG